MSNSIVGPARHAVPGQTNPWRERGVALAVFALSLGVGLWNVTDATSFQDDEGVYAAQALAVTQGELAPYTYWYDHPPLGWLQLALFGSIPKLFGVGDGSEIPVMRSVIAVLFALSATLVYLIARRLGTARLFALAGAAVFVASPLALTSGRQVFLDNIVTPWVLLAFWLMLSPRRALWAHLGSGAAFGVALLTKLTAAVFGPALLVALLSQGRWRGRSLSLMGFFAAGGLVLAMFPLMAALRSELFTGEGHVSLQDGLMFQFGTRATSGSFWDASSDRRELVMGWVSTDPVILLVGLIGAVVCAFVASSRWISVAIFTFAVPMVFGQGYLPGMYIVGSLAFLALAAAVGAHHLWRALNHGLHRLAVARPALVTPGRRTVATTALATIAATLALLGALPVWQRGSLPLMTATSNADWWAATDWIEENVPLGDDILVPSAAWTQVQEDGRAGGWDVIMLEKVDRDPQFRIEHPEGWRDLEWILVGPTVPQDLVNLDLVEATKAYESSRVAATFGQWEIREVQAP